MSGGLGWMLALGARGLERKEKEYRERRPNGHDKVVVGDVWVRERDGLRVLIQGNNWRTVDAAHDDGYLAHYRYLPFVTHFVKAKDQDWKP